MVGEMGCSERENPVDFLLPRAARRAQVEVHAVLELLAVRHGDEKQELTAIPRADQAFVVSRLVRVVKIFDEVQYLRPEHGLRVGVNGVERGMRDAADHVGSLDRARQVIKRLLDCCPYAVRTRYGFDMSNAAVRPSKRHRLEMRVTPEQEALIRHAAELEGTTVTTFVLDTATAQASSVIEAHRDLVLPNDAFDRFLAELDKPAAAVPALVELFRGHAKLPEA